MSEEELIVRARHRVERKSQEHHFSDETVLNMKRGYEIKCEHYESKIKELETQIEKLIDFVLSKTECCDIYPIIDTCINSEGTCPYARILSKGEEEVTREWLIQFISRR